MPHPSRPYNGLATQPSRRLPYLLGDILEAAGLQESGEENELVEAWPADMAEADVEAAAAALEAAALEEIPRGPFGAVSPLHTRPGNEMDLDGVPHGAQPFFPVMDPAAAENGSTATGPGTGFNSRAPRQVTAPAPHGGTAPGAGESSPPAQAAYFRDARFALLGFQNPDGSISIIEPPTPAAPEKPARGE